MKVTPKATIVGALAFEDSLQINDLATPDRSSEQAGSMEASRTIAAMHAAPDQATRFTLFHEALCSLNGSSDSRAALAGFSVVVVALLDRAMGKGAAA